MPKLSWVACQAELASSGFCEAPVFSRARFSCRGTSWSQARSACRNALSIGAKFRCSPRARLGWAQAPPELITLSWICLWYATATSLHASGTYISPDLKSHYSSVCASSQGMLAPWSVFHLFLAARPCHKFWCLGWQMIALDNCLAAIDGFDRWDQSCVCALVQPFWSNCSISEFYIPDFNSRTSTRCLNRLAQTTQSCFRDSQHHYL